MRASTFGLSDIQIAEYDRARLFSQFSQNICKQQHETSAYSVNFYIMNANVLESKQ